MANDFIKVRGARVHNLKNIDLDIPKNKLVAICGVSGSGKSSLAFDTLYAEGQRRYVESLSVYARQFLGVMQKPDVDKIEGISPAISIDQRKSSHNPRSTVGTITEVYDYLRVLFARLGIPHCPNCAHEVKKQTIDEIVIQILRLPKHSEIYILGPVVKAKKGEHKVVIQEAVRAGFARARIDGIIQRLDEAIERDLDKQKKHSIEIVVDRLVIDDDLERSRLVDSIEIALRLGKGIVIINSKSEIRNSKLAKDQFCLRSDASEARQRRQIQNLKSKIQNEIKNEKLKTRDEEDFLFSERFACEDCGISMPEIEPRLFSFNSPFGACPVCHGLGKKLEVAPELVMPNMALSLAEGAVFPWARASHKIGRQSWYFRLLEQVAQKNGFSLHVPVKDLSKEQVALILHGDKRGFEGVIANLEKRFWSTDSESAREEIKKYMVEKTCQACKGKRLRKEPLAVELFGKTIDFICQLNLSDLKKFFEQSQKAKKISQEHLKIANPLLKEITERLGFLNDVGLGYLNLSRETATLSGGEEQRTRLATQIGSRLSGILYILDEPSVGLHPKDQERLLDTLKKLRDLGNTVIVIEHEQEIVLSADRVIEIGPGAGQHGGKVMFEGTPSQLIKAKTLTGEYLSGRKNVFIDSAKISKSEILNSKHAKDRFCLRSDASEARQRRQIQNPKSKIQNEIQKDNFLIIKGAKENNLKNIDVRIPLEKFVCITGVSGSGKSSLVQDILARALCKKFYHSKDQLGKHNSISGMEFLDKVALVTQDPIGRTPRSNPATYAGVFNYVREIFAATKEAKIRGYKSGRFSFNVKAGRCEECEGQGVKKIEMYFLPDVYVQCQNCLGKRYSRETLEIEHKGKSIADILLMTIEEALNFFENFPALKNKLKTLLDVGLSYIKLGQPATSLSGGEAQRVKLASELSKQSSNKTIYILDEPTTGLHPDDIRKLILILKRLVQKGNTVLVTEHNLDVIFSADWVIDLGPDGGDKGGYIVDEGAPEAIAKNSKSLTGQFLRKRFFQ